ncbi:MAG: bacteriocin-protection protein YdeI/OmpD-associated family [Candidatus Saccharibacteria bacterium]|nr:bacteriocin-protection protein YdeI/OmpD-associated family [Candidatus Saccharibacteria bacterium]
MKPDYPTLPFINAEMWRAWLDENHVSTDGVWIRIYKKASDIPTVTHAEALDQALCYGWIDGQRKSFDELSFLQKFTPRRSKSLWSKRNIEHIERLTDAGLMMQAGLAEVTRAQQDGRWQAAYDAPSNMTVSDEFLAELGKHPKAKLFFETLNKTNRYAIAWRLQTAKTETTRNRRQDKIIAMLNEGQKLN